MADTTHSPSNESSNGSSWGSPCWVAIPAADVKACKKFYSELFPAWTFSSAPDRYAEDEIAMLAFSGKSGLTGGIIKVPAECKAAAETKAWMGVTIYHLVESIDETHKLILSLGGKEWRKKEEEGQNGWAQDFLDVEGNRFGLYEVRKKA